MAVHGGYTEHFVGRVSSLARRVSRATRRLLRHRLRYGVSASSSSSSSRRKTRPVVDPAGSGGGGVAESRRQPAGGVVPAADGKGDVADADAENEEDDGIWRRAILMGGRCQPLDFAGAIHYDSFGRRLARPPSAAPRCASSLSCRSSDSLATYLETTEV
ncbi:hypothetical protein CFC21_014111 [Triticum aestivum]|uniref:Uncharacterized protein n=2 Tax=Triticum aestivum TaxID=4565 RepID=A0A3B6A2A5_WHEAT|nr:uncharacterized protein LOC123178398 [Triticum aestivum]KAF6997945.1 hypothetical protein CFC21_014111 [Triticum aestivum]